MFRSYRSHGIGGLWLPPYNERNQSDMMKLEIPAESNNNRNMDTPTQGNNNNVDNPIVPDPNQKTDIAKDKGQTITATLVIATLFGSLGSSFTHGYSITMVNSPATYVQEFYNHTWLARYGEPLGCNSITLLWSITVSIASIGSIFGTLPVGPLVKVMGSKGTLLLNNGFTLGGAVFMAAAESAGSFEMMIIGRFLSGVHSGLGRIPIVMLLTEISPRPLRGAVGQINGVLYGIGLITAQVLGLKELLGQKNRWSFLFGFMAIPALLQLCVLPFVPESPRYLLIDRNDVAAAENALRRYLGKEDVSQEVEELQVERRLQANVQKVSVVKLMRSQTIRWQIITVIVLNCGRTFSGMNAMYFYTTPILENAGMDANLILYMTIGLGAAGLVSSIVCGFVIDRCGRRLLLLLGFGGMAVGFALLTLYLNIQNHASWISFLSFACIIFINIAFCLGPAAVLFIVCSELFEQTYRPPALMLGGLFGWMTNFILGLVFPFMQKALRTYVFLVFLVICALCAVYVYMVLPETKDKTFVEISHSFKEMNKILDDSPKKPEPDEVANGTSDHVKKTLF